MFDPGDRHVVGREKTLFSGSPYGLWSSSTMSAAPGGHGLPRE
jgi:hypothetical protein